MPTISHRYVRHAPPQNSFDDFTFSTNDISMDRICDNIKVTIMQSRS
jgi:hypothetical protein